MLPQSELPSTFGRVTGLIFVSIVSLLLPVAIIVGTVGWAMSGKPFGWHSTDYQNYTSCLKNNEMWYFVAYPLGPTAKMIQKCHLTRMNLDTGDQIETGITSDDEKLFGKLMVWIGEDLYFFNDTEVSRIAGQGWEQLGNTRSPTSPFLGPLFEYEGRLTIVSGTENGDFRLNHWDGTQWGEGRRIILPRTNRIWYHDSERDRKSLLPSTSAQPLLVNRTTFPELQIKQSGGELTLLVQSEDANFAAFRRGFDFVEDDETIASALVPANGIPEATGWLPVPHYPDGREAKRREAYVMMFANRDGIHFMVCDNQFDRKVSPRIFRMMDHDRFQELTTEYQTSPRSELRLFTFVADPSEPNSYLIRWSQRETGKAEISRIEGDVIRPPHLSIPGGEPEYLDRWKRIAIGLVVAWLVHLLVLTIGVSWLSKGQSVARDGELQFTLAPIWRRSLAFVLDVGLILFGGVVAICVRENGFLDRIVWPNGGELVQSLHHIELLLWWYLSQGLSPLDRLSLVTNPMKPFFQSLPFSRENCLILIAFALVLYVIKLFLECRYGTTPGKWLVGIRTTTTTLRPMRLAPALVRDIMIWCDIPLLLTPLPAAVSMILSDRRQRLGDRVADSIVISVKKIRN